jgi:hypothetical protein
MKNQNVKVIRQQIHNYNSICFSLFRIYYICLTNCKYDVGKYLLFEAKKVIL